MNKAWTEADFKDYQSGKRLQDKVACLNAITAYRTEMEKLEKLGLMKANHGKARPLPLWEKMMNKIRAVKG